MTMKNYLTFLFLIIFCRQAFGQHLGLSFNSAKSQGMSIEHLDSIYQSAVHIDTSQAVFKTDLQQEEMGNEYINLLHSFGKFLTENNFIWEKPTKGFNRIYFNKDGTIDYFIYNFSTEISEEKQIEFNRLLNLFIKDYKMAMTANTKFAQCSPVTYKPKEPK